MELGITIYCLLYSIAIHFEVGAEISIVECPQQDLGLIQSEKVASSFVEHGGTNSFSTLLSSASSLGEGYFHAFDVPNIGHIVFDEDLVLYGLTTQGYEVSSDSYFVSNFTFQYSNSTDSVDYETYPAQIIANSFNERSMFFNKPIQARKVQFIIHNTVSPTRLYYWKLKIIGCEMIEAIKKRVSTTSITVTTSQAIKISTSSEVVPIVTTTMMNHIQYSSISSEVNVPPSVVFRGDTEELPLDDCQRKLTVAITVLLSLLVLGGVIVSVAIGALCYWKRIKSAGNSSSSLSSSVECCLSQVIKVTEPRNMTDTSYYNSSMEFMRSSLLPPQNENRLTNGQYNQLQHNPPIPVINHQLLKYLPPVVNSHSFPQSINGSSSPDTNTGEEIESTYNISYSVL